MRMYSPSCISMRFQECTFEPSSKRPCLVPVAAYVIKFDNFGQGRVPKYIQVRKKGNHFGERNKVTHTRLLTTRDAPDEWNAHLESSTALVKEF